MSAPGDMDAVLAALTALEASWPPEHAETLDEHAPVWRARRAPGGGSRVNSARALTADLAALRDGLAAVERHYRGHGAEILAQWPLAEAEAAPAPPAPGYTLFDQTVLLAASASALATPPRVDAGAVIVTAPIAAIDALWADGGVGPARRAVMARAAGPTAVLAARTKDRIAGLAFIAAAAEPAVLHALFIRPEARRSGLAQRLIGEAAAFAQRAGRARLMSAVVADNAAARTLHTRCGFTPIGAYVYARKA